MNPHTMRAREIAERDYQAFRERTHKSDLAAWIMDMQARGLSANTLRQRVSLIHQCLGYQGQKISLPPRKNEFESKWLTLDQLQVLLGVIPNNPSGRRDFALISILLTTDLRRGMIRRWKWHEIPRHEKELRIRNDHFPGVIINALNLLAAYPEISTCEATHADTTNDFIFTPKNLWRRVGSTSSEAIAANRPLSCQEINRRIKRYARLAGLEPEGLNAEALRRTQKELGKDRLINLIQNSLASRQTGPVRWKRFERDKRLHGIGRRRSR